MIYFPTENRKYSNTERNLSSMNINITNDICSVDTHINLKIKKDKIRTSGAAVTRTKPNPDGVAR